MFVECYSYQSTAKTVAATAAMLSLTLLPLSLLQRPLHINHHSSSCHQSNGHRVHCYFRQLAVKATTTVITTATIATAPATAVPTYLLADWAAPRVGCGDRLGLPSLTLLTGGAVQLVGSNTSHDSPWPRPVDGRRWCLVLGKRSDTGPTLTNKGTFSATTSSQKPGIVPKS